MAVGEPPIQLSPPHARIQPKNVTTSPLEGVFQDATLKSLLASNTLAVATGHTFTVYTRNTNR